MYRLLILVFFPTIAFAQSIELSATAGINSHSIPRFAGSKFERQYSSSAITKPTYGIKAGVHFSKWLVGVKATMQEIAIKANQLTQPYRTIANPSSAQAKNLEVQTSFGSPLIAVSAEADRVIRLAPGNLTLGLSVGYAFASGDLQNVGYYTDENGNKYPVKRELGNNAGFIYGINAGYTYFPLPRLGLTAQASIEQYLGKVSGANLSYLLYSARLGIAVKL